MSGAAITPAQLRVFAGLPAEVPEAFLAEHIGVAARDLARRTGLMAAPAGQGEEWREALVVRALANAFPWLNTFALSGAAKVGRLEGSLEYRFLDVEDVEGRVKALMDRFAALVSILTPPGEDGDASDHVGLSGVTMIAI